MLKTRIAKLEDVPEAQRELYEAKDDGFVLKVDGDAADLFPGLTATKNQLLSEKKSLAQQLEAMKAVIGDRDLDKIKKTLTDAEAAEKEALKIKGDWESREKQLQEQFNAEIKKRDDRITALNRAIETHLVEAQATAAVAAAKGSPVLLLPHIKKAVKVFEENGEFIAKVVDGDGNPRIADVKGTPMSVAQLVEEMRKDEALGRAFESTQRGGSGAQQQHTSSPGGQDFSKLSAIERLKAARRQSVT